MRRPAALAALLGALASAGCGGGSDDEGGSARTVTESRTRVEVVEGLGEKGRFDARSIYRELAPGVVTVVAIGGGRSVLGGDGGAVGSGFVLNGGGEVATNAHVVTSGEGTRLRRAKEVYVAFADGNRVRAKIVGVDPNADVALLEVPPAGLELRPLRLAHDSRLIVGSPVAAIGSPFGEPQSLSVGVISGLDRSIESLTGFAINGAIQTDAAINHGNSGGPLVDERGSVLGINSQIRSTGGGGEGVGFAVPVATVRRSLDELRRRGRVQYAYLGVSTVELYPQLVERFDLEARAGAWVQEVTAGSPAAKAGLKGGGEETDFQAASYRPGGDVIVAIDGERIGDADDVSRIIAARSPGRSVRLTIVRGGQRRTVTARLAARPSQPPRAR